MKSIVVAGLLVLASVAGAADTPWATKVVPTATFGQFPALDEPSLSPSGTAIAAKIRGGGGQVLAIVPVGGTGQPEIVARDGAESVDRQGDRTVRAWRWLDDDHLLVTITYRDNLVGEWIDVVRHAAYNRKTRKTVALAWDDALGPNRILWSSNSGHPHVLIQRINPKFGPSGYDNPEVVDVDADTGRVTQVQRPNPIVSGWVADLAGVVRGGSSYDRETGRTRILYRNGPADSFATVVDGTTDRYDDVAIPALMLTGANAKSYAYSRKDGFRALYEFDPATRSLGKRVFGVKGYDIDAAMPNAARDTLDGVMVTEGRTRIAYFDPLLRDVQASLEESIGRGNVLIESTDRARTKFLFRAARPGQVPAYYMFDLPSGTIGLVGWSSETLHNAQLNPVTVERYAASDGRSVEAVVTMPRHRAREKNLPLIVLPHGGPWSRDSGDWDTYQWAQALAELGYVVVQPNFLGSTGYGGAWEKGAEGKWGYRMSDDLNDAVAWLAARGTVDAKRVCMFGWSYGGYASARAAQRDGKTYRCAIAGAAPVDMRAMVAYDRNYLGRYGAKQALGSASTNLDDISPAVHAEQVSIPILIVHGAKDERVPVAQARGFVAKLKKAGKVEGRDFEYLEQPQNTHNLLREADRIQLLERVRTFLAKHNPV